MNREFAMRMDKVIVGCLCLCFCTIGWAKSQTIHFNVTMKGLGGTSTSSSSSSCPLPAAGFSGTIDGNPVSCTASGGQCTISVPVTRTVFASNASEPINLKLTVTPSVASANGGQPYPACTGYSQIPMITYNPIGTSPANVSWLIGAILGSDSATDADLVTLCRNNFACSGTGVKYQCPTSTYTMQTRPMGAYQTYADQHSCSLNEVYVQCPNSYFVTVKFPPHVYCPVPTSDTPVTENIAFRMFNSYSDAKAMIPNTAAIYRSLGGNACHALIARAVNSTPVSSAIYQASLEGCSSTLRNRDAYDSSTGSYIMDSSNAFASFFEFTSATVNLTCTFASGSIRCTSSDA